MSGFSYMIYFYEACREAIANVISFIHFLLQKTVIASCAESYMILRLNFYLFMYIYLFILFYLHFSSSAWIAIIVYLYIN